MFEDVRERKDSAQIAAKRKTSVKNKNGERSVVGRKAAGLKPFNFKGPNKKLNDRVSLGFARKSRF